jgi:hypothetical protein
MITTLISTERKHMKKTKRFVTKFNNGYWKLFDRENFEDVAIFMLRKEVLLAEKEANGKV